MSTTHESYSCAVTHVFHVMGYTYIYIHVYVYGVTHIYKYMCIISFWDSCHAVHVSWCMCHMYLRMYAHYLFMFVHTVWIYIYIHMYLYIHIYIQEIRNPLLNLRSIDSARARTHTHTHTHTCTTSDSMVTGVLGAVTLWSPSHTQTLNTRDSMEIKRRGAWPRNLFSLTHTFITHNFMVHNIITHDLTRARGCAACPCNSLSPSHTHTYLPHSRLYGDWTVGGVTPQRFLSHTYTLITHDFMLAGAVGCRTAGRARARSLFLSRAHTFITRDSMVAGVVRGASTWFSRG